jgi:hypothetical protein
MGSHGHADIGYQLYVSMNMSPCASSDKPRMKRQRRCPSCSTPDIVTRIFMLLRGVHSDGVGLWVQAATRATEEDGATFWTKVVGVDGVRVSDRTSGVGWRLSELCKDSGYLLCVGNGTHVLYKNGVDILVRRLSLLSIFDMVFLQI